MMRARRLAWMAAVAAAACTAGPDHERLGDRRYAEHAFVDALAEYRLAMQQHRPSEVLRAKFAQAALRSGALTDAMVALHDVAPQRPVGPLVVALGASSTALAKRPEAMDVLLQAAAAAPPAAADSFLEAYGDVNARLGRCDLAARVYSAVVRRSRVPALGRAAQGGLAWCAVADGKLSLSAGALDDAQTQFGRAIAIGTPDSTVRLAWLLMGDARWAGGDTTRALDAYRHVVAGAPEQDPLVVRASAQMDRLLKGNATP